MIASEYEKLKAVGLSVEELLFHTARVALVKEFDVVENDDTDKGLFNILGHEVYLTVNSIPEGFKLSAVIDNTMPSIWKSKPEATLVFEELAAELVQEIKERILGEAIAVQGESAVAVGSNASTKDLRPATTALPTDGDTGKSPGSQVDSSSSMNESEKSKQSDSMNNSDETSTAPTKGKSKKSTGPVEDAALSAPADTATADGIPF